MKSLHKNISHKWFVALLSVVFAAVVIAGGFSNNKLAHANSAPNPQITSVPATCSDGLANCGIFYHVSVSFDCGGLG